MFDRLLQIHTTVFASNFVILLLLLSLPVYFFFLLLLRYLFSAAGVSVSSSPLHDLNTTLGLWMVTSVPALNIKQPYAVHELIW